MRVAVVGSEGYLGTALVPPLLRGGHEVLRIDACLWGQPPGGRVVMCHSGVEILRHLRAFKPDTVVWLAALAHDVHGRLDPQLVLDNNAILPGSVGQWALRAGVRFVAVSSFSVFAGPGCGAYPDSKRELEDLIGDLCLYRGASLVRLATLFGVTDDSQVSSFRPHLLLNSFLIDALGEGKVFVDDSACRRPVCPLQWAVSSLAGMVEEPVGGQVQNVHLCSGSLKDYAQFVADITGSKVILRPAQDSRDYSFPPLLASDTTAQEMLRYELAPLKEFVGENLKQLVKLRAGCWQEYYRRAEGMRLYA